MPDPTQTVTPDETELQDLWKKAYPDNRKRTLASILKGDETWEQLQPKHLPLTLKAMVNRGLDTRGARLDDSTVTRFREADPSSKALILMVGYSLEQLALCVAYQCLVFRCRKFVPFFSENTRGPFHQDIGRLLRMMEIAIDDGGGEKTVEWIDERVIKDPNDPSQVFKAIVRWIREAKSGLGGIARLESFAVDATGGQKPMDSGASAAAGFYGLPAFYLHFTEYDDQLRKPLPYTLRYSRLILPDVTFSHHNRVALHAAIESAQFERAAARLSDIEQSMELYPDYFDDGSKDNIKKVSQVVEESRNWFEQGYAEGSGDVEPAGELDVGGQPADLRSFWRLNCSLGPREMIEAMRQRCGQSVTNGQDKGWLLLLEYVVDEYHRLNILSQQGHHRDVVMGSRGLAELVVDSLFFFSWFRQLSRVESIKLIAPDPEKDPGSFKNLDQQCGGLLNSLKQFFCNQSLDPAFLHLDDSAKNDLLTSGEANFTIWAKRVDGTNGTKWAKLDPKDNPTVKLRVEVKAPVMTVLRKDSKATVKQVWTDHFSFPATKERWAETRNALTHVRSPLNKDIVQLSCDVMTIYLPRIIELLCRLGEKGEPVDLLAVVEDDGCTWLKQPGSPWREDARVPWRREGFNLTSLLEIEPLVGQGSSTHTQEAN
jgi:hypothetical protein